MKAWIGLVLAAVAVWAFIKVGVILAAIFAVGSIAVCAIDVIKHYMHRLQLRFFRIPQRTRY